MLPPACSGCLPPNRSQHELAKHRTLSERRHPDVGAIGQMPAGARASLDHDHQLVSGISLTKTPRCPAAYCTRRRYGPIAITAERPKVAHRATSCDAISADSGHASPHKGRRQLAVWPRSTSAKISVRSIAASPPKSARRAIARVRSRKQCGGRQQSHTLTKWHDRSASEIHHGRHCQSRKRILEMCGFASVRFGCRPESPHQGRSRCRELPPGCRTRRSGGRACLITTSPDSCWGVVKFVGGARRPAGTRSVAQTRQPPRVCWGTLWRCSRFLTSKRRTGMNLWASGNAT